MSTERLDSISDETFVTKLIRLNMRLIEADSIAIISPQATSKVSFRRMRMNPIVESDMTSMSFMLHSMVQVSFCLLFGRFLVFLSSNF